MDIFIDIRVLEKAKKLTQKMLDETPTSAEMRGDFETVWLNADEVRDYEELDALLDSYLKTAQILECAD
jgi:hypothetical protein